MIIKSSLNTEIDISKVQERRYKINRWEMFGNVDEFVGSLRPRVIDFDRSKVRLRLFSKK